MKNILILLILLTLNLFAFDSKIASKIFDKLFLALISKEIVYVYTKDSNYFNAISLAKHLKLVEDIDKANIVLVNKFSNIPQKNILLFTTNFELYKSNEHTLGVFYWKHGRPRIIFSKERLINNNISMSPKWNKYIRSDSEL